MALPRDCRAGESLIVAQYESLVPMPPDPPLAKLVIVPVAAMASERLLLLKDGQCLREHAVAVCGLLGKETGEA